MSSNRAGHGARAIAALHPHHVTWRERIGEPVDLFEGHLVSEQLRAASADDGAVDAPEEIRLVLGAVAAAVQRAALRDRVMARRDGVAIERVGVIEEIAELRE